MTIKPGIEQKVTRIYCPSCKEKVHGVGLIKGAAVEGLTFKCKRCGRYWEVREEKRRA